MAPLFCLPLLLTQALAALINRCQRAARSKDAFANMATGRFRMFANPALTASAFPAIAHDFQLLRVPGPCFGGGFLMTLNRSGEAGIRLLVFPLAETELVFRKQLSRQGVTALLRQTSNLCLERNHQLARSMPITTQPCACEPCNCEVDPQSAIEKDGKMYCSAPCADGHAGNDACCTSCDCC